MSEKHITILNTAMKLFAAYGYHAVGIDRIIAESGVAKMTMYKYFPTKTSLILDVLKERDRRFRDSLFAFADGFEPPTEKLQAVFTWHDRWLNEPSFNGCMFINAAAEYPDIHDEVHRIAIAHKQAIQDYLQAIVAKPLKKLRAQQLAAQLSQLLDGAIVAAQVMGDNNAALTAWRTASILLKAEKLEPDSLQ